MELLLAPERRTLIVRVYGDLDHRKAEEIRLKADRELLRTGSINVAFDFGHVTFMDSSGIGVIMGRYKEVSALGGNVIIYGASSDVKRLISMAQLDKLVTVADSLESGIKEASAYVQK